MLNAHAGIIPKELGSLHHLQELKLSGNKLTGQRYIARTKYFHYNSLYMTLKECLVDP